VAQPATLPIFLQRTPEQVLADEAAQEARRASFTRAKLSDGERLIARGAQLEEIARANISQMEAHREERHTVSTRGGANLEMLEQQRALLAHALELQGRFLDAAEVAPLKTEQKRLRAIHDAVEAPDETCDCPRDEHELNGVKIEISPRRMLKTIYSRKHGREIALMKCDKCGDLFALPLTGQAAEIAGARQASRAAGQSVRSDVQVLRAVK
jgi:hypothetical protein